MAGRYQPRPTRVTTLTSLSNFKARPLESPTELDSPAWDAAVAEGPATPPVTTANAGAAGAAEPSQEAQAQAAGNGRSREAIPAAAGGGQDEGRASVSARESPGEDAVGEEDAAAVAALLSEFVNRLRLSAQIRVEVFGEGKRSRSGPLEDISVEGSVVGLGELSLRRKAS